MICRIFFCSKFQGSKKVHLKRPFITMTLPCRVWLGFSFPKWLTCFTVEYHLLHSLSRRLVLHNSLLCLQKGRYIARKRSSHPQKKWYRKDMFTMIFSQPHWAFYSKYNVDLIDSSCDLFSSLKRSVQVIPLQWMQQWPPGSRILEWPGDPKTRDPFIPGTTSASLEGTTWVFALIRQFITTFPAE